MNTCFQLPTEVDLYTTEREKSTKNNNVRVGTYPFLWLRWFEHFFIKREHHNIYDDKNYYYVLCTVFYCLGYMIFFCKFTETLKKSTSW